MKNFTTEETQTLEEIGKHVNIEALSEQFETVLATKDPMGYMEGNINWEIDSNYDLSDDKGFSVMAGNMFRLSMEQQTLGYLGSNPIRRFFKWFKNNFDARRIRKALCKIANKIKDLIDEEAELTTILAAGLIAVAGIVGVSINPLLQTLIVGILVMMLLKGVDNVCSI